MESLKRALQLPTIVTSPRQLFLSSFLGKSPESYLLQLPVELVYLIEKFLTPVDLALLAQTCRALRVILEKHKVATQLPSGDYRKYLYRRARGLPKKWACWHCRRLHPIVKIDTPTALWDQSSCPLSSCWIVGQGRNWVEGKCNSRIWGDQIRIGHQHVQLALKYTRLQQRKYNSYLRALLAPHHDLNFGLSETVPLETHYSVYPKVVPGQDGNPRFIVLATWRYYKDSGDISLCDIGELKICPHLELDSPEISVKFYGPECALKYAFKRTLKGRGEGVGSCASCATDFTVRLGSGYLDLHVWQDFGPEGTLTDHAHFNYPMSMSMSMSGMKYPWCDGPAQLHGPGTIRRLYGPEPSEKAVKPRWFFTAFPKIFFTR